ncbi:unnamed protein product [Triticum turgidum subsp. durum]|uniref:PPPDE domain-containing protein n=1 Tax=Triticum turgidum subsp. durum TaxID=4567 RepID=A0A9R0ZIE0_TRITD|nr:unnamed protein product [Triticum turgidum subsp. durum]
MPSQTHLTVTPPPGRKEIVSGPDSDSLARRRLVVFPFRPSPQAPSQFRIASLAPDQNPNPRSTYGLAVDWRASPATLLGISLERGGRGEAMGGAISVGAAATGEYPVVLNVYDLTPLNNYVHWCGLGIFHSAVEGIRIIFKIEIGQNGMSFIPDPGLCPMPYFRIIGLTPGVHGSEYSFGAHDLPTSGVFEVEPKSCPGFLYRSSIFIGLTSLHPLEFRDFIQRMASEYHGDTYHLISKNCNHFTDDLSTRLTGKPIPGWVNRLAKLGAGRVDILQGWRKFCRDEESKRGAVSVLTAQV